MHKTPEEKPEKTRSPNWGGKRPGSGKKKGVTYVQEHLRRVRVGVRLPRHMDDWLRAQKIPSGRIIEIALDHYWRTMKPIDGEEYFPF